jgi:hypothetical protein
MHVSPKLLRSAAFMRRLSQSGAALLVLVGLVAGLPSWGMADNTVIDQKAFDLNESRIKQQCKAGFDYGKKLLTLTPAALKGTCVVIPNVTTVIIQEQVSTRSFVAAVVYPIQQIAGVKATDPLATNSTRVGKTIKRYGLQILGINGTFAMPMVAKPVLVRMDEDIPPFSASGRVFPLPAVFIVVGSFTFKNSQGQVFLEPELQYVGQATLHRISVPDVFPS